MSILSDCDPEPTREKPVRLIAAAVAIAFLLTPAAPVLAHHSKAKEHQEFAAATKKKSKAPKRKPAKEKYLRAVPSR
jgi:hypothetical protein